MYYNIMDFMAFICNSIWFDVLCIKSTILRYGKQQKVYFVKLICFRLWYLFCLFDTVCVLEFFFKQEANRLQYHVLYTCFSSCQLLRSLWSLNILMEIFQFQMMLRDVQYIFIYRYYLCIYVYHTYIYIYVLTTLYVPWVILAEA